MWHPQAKPALSGRPRPPASTVAIGAALIVLLAAGVAYWLHPKRSNPDPGGRILAQLARVAGALPSDATVLYRRDGEPTWDSCDGVGSTAGWTDASVTLGFTTGQTADLLLAHVQNVVASLGWGSFARAPVPGLTASWSRDIDGSPGPARLQLSNSSGTGGWLLLAQAPAIGRAVSGC